jgi:signal transduction histidine kinase
VALGVAIGLIAVLGPFAFLILGIIGESSRMTAAERLRLARTTAASIDGLIAHAESQLVELATPDLTSPVTLERGHRLIRTFEELVVVDREGRQVAGHPDIPETLVARLDESPAFRATRESGRSSAGLVDLTDLEHPPVASIAAPIRDGSGRVTGILVGVLHLAHGWTAPLAPLPPGSATFMSAVVDERGMILATSGRPPAASPVGGQLEPVRLDPHVPVLLPLLRAKSPGVRVHRNGAEEHLAAFAPLDSLPAGVVVEEREDLALAVPNRLRRLMILFGVAALVIVSAAAWLHARYVTRPLERLEQAMRRIAAGALDEPVMVSRRDEMGMLARSFEAMRVTLGEAAEQRDRWEQQLEARVRERTEEVRTLLARIIHAQEEERRRLARELHDDTAQSVATLLLHMATLREVLPPGQQRVREMLDRTLAQGERALADVRRIIADLRPTALDDLGLIPALRGFAEERLAGAGVRLDFRMRGTPHRLDPPVETALFRILQEAVSNVVRHASARTATIDVEFGPGTLLAAVRDDGRGFERAAPPARSWAGAGLQGMRERADLIRARLEITSRPGAGTSVRVEVPLGERHG